jgi:enoyl-CoA hydratase
MSSQNVLTEVREGVAILTINRPDKLNALNRDTLAALDSSVAGAAADPGVLAIVITGAGPKAFVAGADIGELAELSPLAGRDYAMEGNRILLRIESLGKVVIAAINGFALGGGCELALACHIRIAAENARLGLPEVTLGLIPGFGGTQRLARIVGKGRGLELTLSGEMIGAAEAHRIGLVNRVVPEGRAVEEATALARTIASRGPVAVRLAIEAVGRGLDLSLAEGLALESTLFGLVVTTGDFKEGTQAFLAKRAAKFQGR